MIFSEQAHKMAIKLNVLCGKEKHKSPPKRTKTSPVKKKSSQHRISFQTQSVPEPPPTFKCWADINSCLTSLLVQTLFIHSHFKNSLSFLVSRGGGGRFRVLLISHSSVLCRSPFPLSAAVAVTPTCTARQGARRWGGSKQEESK